MKIISGKFKGRNIKGYDIEGTRPTMSRVKESLFAMIQDNIKNSSCLDLFSGSGNLGIEAISNGANHCYFIDNDKIAIQTIKENVKNLSIESNSTIILSDWKKALNDFSTKKITFDIIFVDPPYDYDVYEKILNKVSTLNLLKNNGLIILEHHKLNLQNNYNNLNKCKEKQYKDKYITIYKN